MPRGRRGRGRQERHTSYDSDSDESESTPLLPSTNSKITYVSLSSSPSPPRSPLPTASTSTSRPPTPLPFLQTTILFILQLTDPLSSTFFYPFLPHLVRQVGITSGDERKVARYVGLLHSAGYAAQILTVFHWSHFSDHVGRKPVLMIGCLGIALSLFSFGLSTSYWGFFLSRLLNGALSTGNGLVKATVAEYTDTTNIAQAFAYMSVARSVGNTLGPLIGGALSRPSERSPGLDLSGFSRFSRFSYGFGFGLGSGQEGFWKKYPYFLACCIPAIYAVAALVVTGLYLKETVSRPISLTQLFHRRRRHTTQHTQPLKVTRESSESSPSSSEQAASSSNQPLPLKSLLKSRRVLIATLNYSLLSLLDISFRAIQPVFLSTPSSSSSLPSPSPIDFPSEGSPLLPLPPQGDSDPTPNSGLAFTPQTLGILLSLVGLSTGLFQALLFPPFHNLLGPRKIFLISTSTALPMFALFPFMSYLAKSLAGTGYCQWVIYTLVGVQFGLLVVLNMGYCSVFIYVAASSPNRQSIGATTGLGQMSVCIMRTIGPSLASSLYSYSLQSGSGSGSGNGGLNFLGGQGEWLVWYVLWTLSILAVGCGLLLPEKMWTRDDSEDLDQEEN